MADLKFEVDSSEVSRAVDELIRMGKASKDTAKAFEQGFRKVVSWQERFQAEQGRINATLEKNYRAQTLSNKSARESASVFEEVARAVKKAEDAHERTRQKYVEGAAAQARLKEAQRDLSAAYRAGAINIEEYREALIRLNQQSRGNVKGTNNLGVAMQQTGYQVGDFLVQVQSGQNPMVAFGQQATQLVGIMYLLPPATLAASKSILGLRISVAALAMSLGIIIPIATAIGAAFMRMREENDKTAKSISRLDDKLKSITSSLEDYADLQKAIASGVSLEEYFAIKGVDKAKRDLDSAKEALASLIKQREDLANTPLPPMMAIVAFAKNFFDAKGASKEELAAIAAVQAAETTLANLRQKEADKRASNFAESSLALKQELDILQLQVRQGAKSSQVKKEASAQELRNTLAAIDARVEAGELDASAAAYLKQQVKDVADLTRQVEANTLAEERRVEAIKLAYEYSQKQAEVQAANKAAVDDILESVDRETKSLEDQIELNSKILKHGEDSIQVAELRAKQERDAYIQQKMSEGILGNNLKAVMDVYDALTDQKDRLAEIAAEETARVEKARQLRDLLSNLEFPTYGSAVSAGDAFDPRGETGLTQTEALRRKLASGRPNANVLGIEDDAKPGSSLQTEDNGLESFIEGLMTERETLEQWRSEQLDLLGTYNESELEIIGGQAEAKLRLEQKYSDRLVKIKKRESDMVSGSAKAMYGDLAGLLNMFAGKSKAAAIASIALTKGLRIAEIIASGAAAQVRALAELGPILGPPAAAKIAGFTKVQAGIVAATGLMQAGGALSSGGDGGLGSGGGGGLGSSQDGAAATMPAQSQPATPQKVIIEGIDRSSLISGEQLSNIFEALYEENENRGFVFEVAR